MKALKFSRQRESIRECLKNRTDHPTADAVYVTISKDYPKISLGTVYRNLNLLADMGEIQRFSSGDGSEHFDYNTDPHYHFVCRTCGAIIDMPLELVHDTPDLLSAPFPGRVDSHTVFFYGECEDCLKKNSSKFKNSIDICCQLEYNNDNSYYYLFKNNCDPCCIIYDQRF